jgi:hypothetical protein
MAFQFIAAYQLNPKGIDGPTDDVPQMTSKAIAAPPP